MNKVMIATLLAAVAASSFTMTATAQSGYKKVNPPHRQQAEEVMYLEGKYLDADAKFSAANVGSTEDGIGGSRFVFGYEIYPQVALEIGWTQFDEIEESGSAATNSWETVTDVSGYTLGAKAFLPLRDRARAWATVGYYFWDADFEVVNTFGGAGVSASGSASYSGSDPYWGFGIDFLLTPRAHLSIEYGQYQQDELFDNQGDASAEQDFIGFGLGLAF